MNKFFRSRLNSFLNFFRPVTCWVHLKFDKKLKQYYLTSHSGNKGSQTARVPQYWMLVSAAVENLWQLFWREWSNEHFWSWRRWRILPFSCNRCAMSSASMLSLEKNNLLAKFEGISSYSVALILFRLRFRMSCSSVFFIGILKKG